MTKPSPSRSKSRSSKSISATSLRLSADDRLTQPRGLLLHRAASFGGAPADETGTPIKLIESAALYFAIVFAAGFVLGPVRELWAVPRFGRRVAELIEEPIMLLAVVIAARWTVRRFRVSLETTKSLSIGLIALGFLLGAELLVVLALRSLSVAEYIKSRDPVSGIVYLLMLGVFALMPWLVSLRVVDSAANRTRGSTNVQQNEATRC